MWLPPLQSKVFCFFFNFFANCKFWLFLNHGGANKKKDLYKNLHICLLLLICLFITNLFITANLYKSVYYNLSVYSLQICCKNLQHFFSLQAYFKSIVIPTFLYILAFFYQYAFLPLAFLFTTVANQKAATPLV